MERDFDMIHFLNGTNHKEATPMKIYQKDFL